MSQNYQVAAYYFPQFHRDPRNDRWHGDGWTEWDLLKAATPRYPGHRQPIVPAWGYFDESDPAWAAREIDLAADHGITTFIYDWYWYAGRPFLEGALEQGFLRAPNRERMQFALMWANHDWRHIFPATATNTQELLAGAHISLDDFAQITDYICEHYFTQPNYLCIDGAPYFSIYNIGEFIATFGGVLGARRALDQFREQVRRLGFPDLFVNGIIWGVNVLPSEVRVENPRQAVMDLGLSSISTYTWVHFYEPDTDGFPRGSYAKAAAQVQRTEAAYQDFPLPYHPCVAVGWDPTPRTSQSNPYAPKGYPWTAVLEGNTPEAFAAALQQARAVADRLPAGQRLVTINAWNEWTEGSYLLPDTVHDTAYLEAIRATFGALVPGSVTVHER